MLGRSRVLPPGEASSNLLGKGQITSLQHDFCVEIGPESGKFLPHQIGLVLVVFEVDLLDQLKPV